MGQIGTLVIVAAVIVQAETASPQCSGSSRCWRTYRCTQRKSKGTEVCDNKEIRREYIEEFVMREIEKVIFSDERIGELVESYKEYRGQLGGEGEKKLEVLRKNITENARQIDNLVTAVANCGNVSLIEKLTQLETEKERLQSEMRRAEKDIDKNELSESDIRRAYEKAKMMFRNGTLEEKRQLENLYVDRIVVYREHIEVYLNSVPPALKANELTDETVRVNGELLAHYIFRNRRANGCKLHKKRASTLSIMLKVETFDGGGEAANEKVSIRAASDPINEADYDGSDEAIMWKITKYAASLAADFTENSPYRSLPMQNPTEKLAVIGRRTLNYCYNYGEESNVRIFKTHTDIF